MKWVTEWIGYGHATGWPLLRHSLASTRCSDRPGGIDNLLNMYDSSELEYAAFQRLEHERQNRRVEQKKYESLSAPLNCRKKQNSAFFGSHSNRLDSSVFLLLTTLFVNFLLSL